ncbi:1445_t:CDS:2, partial [Rhizophagus irregularis]
PSNSEIYDTVQIAHQNAFNFAKIIDLVSNELELAPIVFVDNNNLVDEDEDKELIAALKVSQSAKIAQNGSIE